MPVGTKRTVGYALAGLLGVGAVLAILGSDGDEVAAPGGPLPGGAQNPAEASADGAATLGGTGTPKPASEDRKTRYVDADEALHIMRITKGWELQNYLQRGVHLPLPPDARIVRRLVALIREDAGRTAISGLARMHLVGMPVRFLNEIAILLEDENAGARAIGLQVLHQWCRMKQTFALPSMLPLVDDEDASVRHAAMTLLAWGAPYDKALQERLVQLIDAQWSPAAMATARVRNRRDLGAARALVVMEDPAFDTFLRLLDAADADGQAVLYAALRYASRDRIARALPTIRASLARADAQVCRAAVAVLVALGPGADPALAELTALLEGPSELVAREALAVVGAMGTRAMIAIPSVVALIEHPDQTLAEAATKTLGLIAEGNDKHARRILVARIREEASDEAAKALAVFGARGLEDALAIIASDDTNAQYAALWTLASLGPEGAKAVPLLIPLIEQEEDRMLRERAIGTVGYIGPKAAAAIPAIMKALASREMPLPASSAAGTLPRLGQAAHAALRRGLGSKDEVLRLQCAIIMQAFHGTSHFALDELAHLLDDRDPNTRRAAITALAHALDEPPATTVDAAAPRDATLRGRLRAVLDLAKTNSDERVRATALYTLARLEAFGASGAR